MQLACKTWKNSVKSATNHNNNNDPYLTIIKCVRMWNIFWKNKWMQSSDFECVDEPVLNEEKIPRFRPHLYSIYMKFHKWITIFDSILSLLHNIKISLVSSSFRYCWWWCGFCAPNTHLNVGLFNIICTLFYVYSYICFPFLFTRMNISQVLWV